jgi:TRAP-type uncharacterized transport system substrate-binding protein
MRFFRGSKASSFLDQTEELGGLSFSQLDDPELPWLRNRTQAILFVVATLVLTALAVWGIRTWFKETSILTFAVGNPGQLESRFANKLATVVANNSASLRIRVVNYPDNDKALAAFDHKQADLAILRTDAKIPFRARAIAVLENDLLLMLSPKGKKITSLAQLKGKKIAVIGDDDRNEAMLRRTLLSYDLASVGTTIQTVPTDSSLDKLLAPNNFAAVIAIEHLTRIAHDKRYEELAKSPMGLAVTSIDEAPAIERKVHGMTDEKLELGLLSAAPVLPEDDLETIGLQWLLVTQSSLSEPKGTDLARIVLENKSELTLDDAFAGQIGPADTDKGALVAAHKGAAAYIDDDTKSFMDRYSDIIYIALAAGSIIGSIFIGVYTAFTRVAPEKAGELATTLLDIGGKIDAADSIEALDKLQDELEALLRQVVVGLRNGTVSGDGLDSFRLSYEFVRDTLALHRERLIRASARPEHRDEPVVVVTKAAS